MYLAPFLGNLGVVQDVVSGNLGIVQDDVLRAMPIGYFFTLSILSKVNFTIVTLGSKVLNLSKMGAFRLSYCNIFIIYKCITKILNNRLMLSC